MNWQMLAAHRLAHYIEHGRARDVAGAGRKRWEDIYDPHAATELGSLILARMSRSGKERDRG